jgi:hypothetical protein
MLEGHCAALASAPLTEANAFPTLVRGVNTDRSRDRLQRGGLVDRIGDAQGRFNPDGGRE